MTFSKPESYILWLADWSGIFEWAGGTSSFSAHLSLRCQVNFKPSLMVENKYLNTHLTQSKYIDAGELENLLKFDDSKWNTRFSGPHRP